MLAVPSAAEQQDDNAFVDQLALPKCGFIRRMCIASITNIEAAVKLKAIEQSNVQKSTLLDITDCPTPEELCSNGCYIY